MKEWKKYLDTHQERFLEELFELLRIPSVSTDTSFREDVFEAAEMVRDKLEAAGADKAAVEPTDGYPIVYGEKIVDDKKPTILVYGHYDVQPADPYDLWETPPFEPVVRKGKIYARGASDDKGQMYMHVKAFEMMMKTDTLPCNVKFMLEGEEETGSKNLEAFVQENKKLLEADVLLISDTAMISNEHPSITVSLRGLSYIEVRVKGPVRDLHSGVYGGAVANPANALAQMIAGLRDKKNRITIPGFYDEVIELSKAERKALGRVPFDEATYMDELGVKALHGEAGYTPLEHTTIRPSMDVNGIWGGYTGDGAKTVLPAEASAKISTRLVPNQRSGKITTLFRKHIESLAPEGVTVETTLHHGAEPVLTPTDSPAYHAASKALKQSYGKTPIPLRTGGSIPIVPMIEKQLGTQAILLGFGLDSDSIHSPNESFGLENFYKGIETIPYFYRYFAEQD